MESNKEEDPSKQTTKLYDKIVLFSGAKKGESDEDNASAEIKESFHLEEPKQGISKASSVENLIEISTKPGKLVSVFLNNPRPTTEFQSTNYNEKISKEDEEKTGQEDKEDEVQYISEDEDMDWLSPSTSNAQSVPKKSGLANNSTTNLENNHWSSSSLDAVKGAKGSPNLSPSPKKAAAKFSFPTAQPDIDISPLGSFELENPNSDSAKMIHLYAKNSVTINATSMSVKIHDILKKQGVFEKMSSSKVTKKPKSFKTGNLKMLLWCKTSPDTIRRLAGSRNSCMAFYDRLCRALPIPVMEIKDHWRSRILLCKVDLGNVHKSRQGYAKWHADFSPPYSFNSVKGCGKFRPNWDKNRNYKDMIVPCGETVPDNRHPNYDLEFNEYLVFHASNIKVKFAVDIEIFKKK